MACRRSASRQMEMEATQMAPAGFVEELVRRLVQEADKQAFAGLRRMWSEVARQTICLAHWRRWLRRAKKLRERTANQRATRVRYEFSISSFDSNKAALRDEAPHFSRSRISRHTLHFNDAYEVSCRARATKCSRCRASFAPIRAASRAEFGSPVGPATRRFIKRNKELAKPSD